MNIYFLERVFPNAHFREGDQEIIQTIIDMVSKDENLDIRNVADKNYISPATISRLTKRAGFKNFKELIFHIKQHIGSNGYENSSDFNLAQSNRSLEETEDFLTKAFDNELIYLFGEGFCETIIDYTYRKLLQSQFTPINLSGIEIGLMRNDQSNTLLVISQSGENRHGLSKIKEIRQNGGTVIAFTATKNSSFTREADLCFVVDAGNWIDTDNTTRNYFYGNTINFLEYLISKQSPKPDPYRDRKE
ncbi:MurR/RpiR family transcriptional regulator [Enterococcus avium]|uniref:MurR/RpiR family transcriptional regulator n=1 Tax=Enterococcus avium TaxID=33945 RepID=UPI0022E92E5A|nr:MurR/RpiR family transcriptional regulator [Enterococcus avium]